MKKLILIPVLAIVFTACKDQSLTENASLTGEQTQKTVTTKQPAKVVYRDRVQYQNTSSNSAKVQKKGMSNSAKYAIVGGVGGAVVGGVATKSTKGAVIGGVVGAGTGYILGRKRDKKTGRIQ